VHQHQPLPELLVVPGPSAQDHRVRGTADEEVPILTEAAPLGPWGVGAREEGRTSASPVIIMPLSFIVIPCHCPLDVRGITLYKEARGVPGPRRAGQT
jgi:hypothetical protein